MLKNCTTEWIAMAINSLEDEEGGGEVKLWGIGSNMSTNTWRQNVSRFRNPKGLLGNREFLSQVLLMATCLFLIQ